MSDDLPVTSTREDDENYQISPLRAKNERILKGGFLVRNPGNRRRRRLIF